MDTLSELVDTQSEQGGDFRLSPQQRHLWALRRGAPPAAYRVQCAFALGGGLDADAFRAAVGEVVERQEILRTRFEVNGGDISAHLSPSPARVPLEERDLRGLGAEERRLRVASVIGEEGERPFDLGRAPLLRLVLLRLSEAEHVLVATQPALCADVRTLKNLVREIGLQYTARLSGAGQDDPVQYADFAEWQHELLDAEEAQLGLTFWRKEFDRSLLSAKLPSEKPRAAEPDFAPAVIPAALTRQEAAALERLAAGSGATLSDLLLTCWHVLLARLTGQRELMVGAAFDGRNYEAFRESLGPFTRYLPFRASVEVEKGFRACLEQTARTTASLSEWQEYFTWEQAAGREDDAAYFPFGFDFEDYRGLPELAPRLSVSAAGWYACTERFKVRLSCARAEQTLACELHYDSAYFEAADIERLSREFRTLARSVLAGPDAAVGELEVVGDADRHRLLVEFNETRVDHPLDVCIHELFERQAERAPERRAVVSGEEWLSYGELNRRANQLAHHLRAMGVGPEVLVGICMERSPEMVVAILGILKAGAAYVPLDPTYPLERLSHMLEDAQVPVLLTQERLLENLPTHWGQTVCFDADADLIAAQPEENPRSGATSANAAYVIYTSGSTGRPKGVVVEHRGVANLAAWQAANFKVDGESRISQFASYSFDAAVGETFMALLNGATLVMLEREYPEPAALIAALNRHEITVCVLVPSLIKELNPDLIERPERLAVVAVGEACSPELALKWAGKCQFMNAYGPTEYTVYSHLWRVDEGLVSGTNAVPIGRPIHNARSYILDERLNPVPCGVDGEIYISGPGIARGYLNHPGLTSEKFVPNPFAAEQEFKAHGPLALESVGAEREEFKRKRAAALADAGLRNGRKHLPPEAIFELVATLDADLVEKTHGFVRDYCSHDSAYDGFCRYLMEGVNGSYASCGLNKEVLRLLLPFDSFEGLKGTDFGFGNTEVLQALAGMGAQMTGLDLNPFFVQKGRGYGLDTRMAKIDVEPEMFPSESRVEEGSQDFVISTLLLDRLEKPKNSLRNLLLVLKEGGRFAVQTLLPIVAMDDGETDDPIVYTPESERLTAGRDVEQDKLTLVSLLHSYGAGDIEVYQLPYTVSSRDGIQEYTLWSFVGRKKAAVAEDAGHYRLMYKTGDLGRYLPDGSIEFRGRIDHQVKIRGFRIELSDIESALLSSPRVKDCVVVASPNKHGQDRLVAYVVAAGDHDLKADELQALLRQKLPEYMVPAAFVTLDSLPLTSNGKLDRRALPAPESAQEASSAGRYVEPRTEAERALAEVWAQVLGRERVGVEENFFELGGDSILSIQVVARANRAGLRLTPKDLFQHPTISRLAAAAGVASQAEGQTDDEASGEVALTPVQHWFFSRALRRPHHFNQSSLLRLRPGSDAGLLRRALQHLLDYHGALRLRFTHDAQGWRSHYAPEETLSWRELDLSHITDAAGRKAAIESEASATQATLDITEGPLLRAVYFGCGEGEPARLLIVIHHLAVDGVSWRILLDDLERAYGQLAAGERVDLGLKTTSYRRWSEALAELAQSAEMREELEYWAAQPWASAARLMEREHDNGGGGERLMASHRLTEEETEALLREAPGAYHAQMDEVLLAALGRALGRAGVRGEVVVELEGHGREEVGGLDAGLDVSRTVGWFTSIYPVLLRAEADEKVEAALRRVKERLRGVPRKGLGYGVLKYLSGDERVREALRGVPEASVVFNYLGQFGAEAGGVLIEGGAEEGAGATQWEGEACDRKVMVNSAVVGGRLEVRWGYGAGARWAEGAAAAYVEELRGLAARRKGAGAEALTASDFPEANLSQSDLDMFIAKISGGARE